MKEYMLLALLDYGRFGFACYRGSFTEIEMDKNAHVKRDHPFVKGYMIIDTSGSIYYYDKEGQHVDEHTLKGV